LLKTRDQCFKLYDDIWAKVEKIKTEKFDQQGKFLSLFKDFYKKDSDQFYQCQKMVRPASINDNDKRLWFFAYIQAFTNLEKNGFYYSCAEKLWAYNVKVDETHYYNNQNIELNKCRAKDFEVAFDQAINGLTLMKNQINKNYRFIEYDTQHGGSHQKLYAWVEDFNKKIVCRNLSSKKIENQIDLFPQDVNWVNFLIDNQKTIE
jgi:hypothetical protein